MKKQSQLTTVITLLAAFSAVATAKDKTITCYCVITKADKNTNSTSRCTCNAQDFPTCENCCAHYIRMQEKTAGLVSNGNAGSPARGNPAPELGDVTIANGPNGSWKCLHAGGKPCTGPEVEALHAAVKSRSNVKDNLITVAPDGALQCRDAATGKACPDTEVQALAKTWNQKQNIPSGADAGSGRPVPREGKGAAPRPQAEGKK